MPSQDGITSVNVQRLAGLAAMPVGVQIVRSGERVPDPSDAPVEGVDQYDREIKAVEDHQTVADKLDYLCDALGGARHYRKVDGNDVILYVKMQDETQYGGRGPTTVEAFNQLLEKIQWHFAVEEQV